jgi:hypothetical protein
MNINQATESFETWLRKQLAGRGGLDATALSLKHKAMTATDKEGSHAFLRATFYRWVQLWLEQGLDGPQVLCVGDTHVENFGTWRDEEGRLVWGVNDFDEVCELSYTSDLVRLGVSVRLALKAVPNLATSTKEACALVLQGYTQAIGATGGTPFVLAENHSILARLVQEILLIKSDVNPAKEYWNKKLNKTRSVSAMPAAARRLLKSSLPDGSGEVEFREPVPDDPPGLGSRGKRRFYAFGIWNGARVLREVKPIVPSAATWALKTRMGPQLAELLASPDRCPDPTQEIRDGWMVRRLAPDATKIELSAFAGHPAVKAEEQRLFESMGEELAHLHKGSGRSSAIAKDLSRRLGKDRDWFESATKAWAGIVEEDHRRFSPSES